MNGEFFVPDDYDVVDAGSDADVGHDAIALQRRKGLKRPKRDYEVSPREHAKGPKLDDDAFVVAQRKDSAVATAIPPVSSHSHSFLTAWQLLQQQEQLKSLQQAQDLISDSRRKSPLRDPSPSSGADSPVAEAISRTSSFSSVSTIGARSPFLNSANTSPILMGQSFRPVIPHQEPIYEEVKQLPKDSLAGEPNIDAEFLALLNEPFIPPPVPPQLKPAAIAPQLMQPVAPRFEQSSSQPRVQAAEVPHFVVPAIPPRVELPVMPQARMELPAPPQARQEVKPQEASGYEVIAQAFLASGEKFYNGRGKVEQFAPKQPIRAPWLNGRVTSFELNWKTGFYDKSPAGSKVPDFSTNHPERGDTAYYVINGQYGPKIAGHISVLSRQNLAQKTNVCLYFIVHVDSDVKEIKRKVEDVYRSLQIIYRDLPQWPINLTYRSYDKRNGLLTEHTLAIPAALASRAPAPKQALAPQRQVPAPQEQGLAPNRQAAAAIPALPPARIKLEPPKLTKKQRDLISSAQGSRSITSYFEQGAPRFPLSPIRRQVESAENRRAGNAGPAAQEQADLRPQRR